MENWNIRDEFIRAINHWYLILGCIVLGGLLGYGFSMVLPAPYRASADLYVGIDVTRVNEMEYLIPLAKTEPLNLDDYKNWQLKQVADIFYSDAVLQAALTDLAAQDPGWQSMSLADFRKHLEIYWYDTGIWRLNYTAADRDRAESAAYAWLAAGHKAVSDLLVFSQQTAVLDADLAINKDASAALKVRSSRLAAFLESSQAWLDKLSSQAAETPLSEEQLADLQDWTLSYQEDADLWQIPLGGFPAQDAPASAYLEWLETSRSQAAAAADQIQLQLDVLAQERETLLPDYHQSLEDSLGLSANLVLKENSSVPEVARVRDTGSVSLAGMGLGLIVWLIYTMVSIRGKNEH